MDNSGINLSSEFRKRSYEVITIDDSDDEIEVIKEEDDIEEYNAENEEEKDNFFTSSHSIQHKLRKNAKFVHYQEWKDYRSAYSNLLRRIEENPLLRQNLPFEVSQRQDKKVTEMQAIRLHQSFNGDVYLNRTTRKTKEPKWETKLQIEQAFYDMKKTGRYEPPSTRVRLMKNLTFAADYTVPVYCDRKIADVSNIDIPETMDFDYTNRNTMTSSITSELQKLLKLSKNHTIKCECGKVGGKMVKCYENSDCKCYKINKKLAKLQTLNAYRTTPTKFKTFGKISMRDIDHYFDTFAFSCSSSCKCEGCCDNNVLYRIENNVNRFEVYRHDDKGFCVRTRNFIPHGSPVFEFTGEILPEKNVLQRGSMDYAYRISDDSSHCGQLIDFLKNTPHLQRELKNELMNVFKTTWHVDPKKKGNESRFVAHGCTPNLSMVRVFQGGFGPHQTRLVMISLEDIFPGTQLTFDYGEQYVTDILRNKCLCKTAGCVQNKQRKLLARASYQDMFVFLSQRFVHMSTEYIDYVIKGKNPPRKSLACQRKRGCWRGIPPKKSRSSTESEPKLDGYRKCEIRGDTPSCPLEKDDETSEIRVNEYGYY